MSFTTSKTSPLVGLLAAAAILYLARRLKKSFPKLRIVVALWTNEAVDKVKPRLLGAGVDELATRLPDVLAQLRLK